MTLNTAVQLALICLHEPERKQCNEQAPHSQSKVTWIDLMLEQRLRFPLRSCLAVDLIYNESLRWLLGGCQQEDDTPGLQIGHLQDVWLLSFVVAIINSCALKQTKWMDVK